MSTNVPFSLTDYSVNLLAGVEGGVVFNRIYRGDTFANPWEYSSSRSVSSISHGVPCKGVSPSETFSLKVCERVFSESGFLKGGIGNLPRRGVFPLSRVLQWRVSGWRVCIIRRGLILAQSGILSKQMSWPRTASSWSAQEKCVTSMGSFPVWHTESLGAVPSSAWEGGWLVVLAIPLALHY